MQSGVFLQLGTRHQLCLNLFWPPVAFSRPVACSTNKIFMKFEIQPTYHYAIHMRQITMKCCTYHDSCAVVVCAKFICDCSSLYKTIAIFICIEFRICVKILLVKWALGSIASMTNQKQWQIIGPWKIMNWTQVTHESWKAWQMWRIIHVCVVYITHLHM